MCILFGPLRSDINLRDIRLVHLIYNFQQFIRWKFSCASTAGPAHGELACMWIYLAFRVWFSEVPLENSSTWFEIALKQRTKSPSCGSASHLSTKWTLQIHIPLSISSSINLTCLRYWLTHIPVVKSTSYKACKNCAARFGQDKWLFRWKHMWLRAGSHCAQVERRSVTFPDQTMSRGEACGLKKYIKITGL